jgi:cell volume regulation protein A
MAFVSVQMQLVIGGAIGYLLGKLLVIVINRLKMENATLYPILVLTFCIFIFSSTYYLNGNSYLAVYVGGLVIGNSRFVHKRSTSNFFDGLSWLSQLSLFLTLGLLVNPSELEPIIIPGLLISLAMMFITRPVSVFLSLIPFRKYQFRDKVFVSWVGLRGAVPIIFAILTLANDVPHARLIFNLVFFCTLVSLILQGTTLPFVAKRLGVAEKPDDALKPKNFDIDFPEEIKSATSEILLTDSILSNGSRLMDLGMPEKTLVIMVRRGDSFFVPTGSTQLMAGDKLLVITDNNEALEETYRKMGIVE